MDALKYEGFGFSYRGSDDPVFDRIDWKVSEGAFVLLGGNTGVGKTTLLRCAHPILAPAGERAGNIEVFGEGVEKERDSWDDGRCARTIAYVSQNPETQIVCGTVWHELAFGLENLGIPQDAMRRRVAEVAHFFGLEPWFHRTTDALSGGQKQLLNLASVLVMQPRLLLLDEPTAQLDPVALKNFTHALFRINRELGITVIVATHEPYEMRAYATEEFILTSSGVEGRAILPHAREAIREEAGRVAQSAAPLCDAPSASAHSPKPAAGRETVCCCDAWFRYDRSSPWVLRGFDLSIDSGTCHALVGGNGCGKSTLLQLVAGSLKPERGRVRNDLRENQALLPQNPKTLFLCDTVAEELHAWQDAAGYTEKEVCAWEERLGLTGLENQHPYDTSGGQQQKIALAKLLLTKPSLLLLDEPTKGLDAPARREMAAVLAECGSKGMTVVLATHDLAFVDAVATHVTMLFDGEATATEEPSAFFADSIFFRPSEAEREALHEG